MTCGENAECLNTEGSYSCGCKSGFTGDGYNCTGRYMNKVHVCELCIERGCIRYFLYLQISMSVQPKACVQLAHSVIILLGATYVNVNQVLPRMVTLVKVCKNTCLIFCVCMYKPSKKKAYSVYG